MILFTIYDLLTVDMMGMGEKPRNIYKRKTKKNSPFGCPPIYKIGSRLFSGAKEPKTSRTYPRWDGNPNLQG